MERESVQALVGTTEATEENKITHQNEKNYSGFPFLFAAFDTFVTLTFMVESVFKEKVAGLAKAYFLQTPATSTFHVLQV